MAPEAPNTEPRPAHLPPRVIMPKTATAAQPSAQKNATSLTLTAQEPVPIPIA